MPNVIANAVGSTVAAGIRTWVRMTGRRVAKRELMAFMILATCVDNVIGCKDLLHDIQVAFPKDLVVCEPDSFFVALGHALPPQH